MKHQIILWFLGCLITSYCSAQPITDDKPITKPPILPLKTMVAVTFIPNDTCNLKIDGKDQGIIIKNFPKTIRLPLGNHRLFFESLETGESIKNRSFRLIRDSVMSGKFTYEVTFNRN